MGLLYRIRLEGLLINAKMLLLLAALWYFCEGFVACNSADGIVSFISVSIAFDTTIAVKWVQRQFSELFKQNIPEESRMRLTLRLCGRFGTILLLPFALHVCKHFMHVVIDL